MRRWSALWVGVALATGCDSAIGVPASTLRGQTASGAATTAGAAAAATVTGTASGSGTNGTFAGGAAGSGTVGSGSGAAAGGSLGGTFDGASAGAATGSSGGASGTGGGGTTLEGSLAFTPRATGEFYGLLPDGGADLSNLDCRISDGLDLLEECEDGPAEPDGGLAASRHILDIYVTSAWGSPIPIGTADVADEQVPVGDAGVYATIEITSFDSDGVYQGLLPATSGSVAYQASAEGMSGSFQASFALGDGGLATLSGDFSAAHCGTLNGY